jgi:glutathione S-transferase
MYTLHYSPGSASLVVHWLLIDLGVEHAVRRVDLAGGEHKRPAYLALNPAGVVPTLQIDGVAVGEAAAMVLHLADAHPGAGLAPAPGSIERARYYQWTFYLANTVQPAFRRWFYPAEAAGPDAAEANKDGARVAIEAAWDRLDDHLQAHGPHLLGTRPSAADFLLTMLMRWSRNMPRPAGDWPALQALALRMKARPSFRRLYEVEELTDWA